MDPFTLALATFGVQKLRGKSTKRSLRDALVIGGMGQLGGMAGVGGLQAFGQTGANTLAGSTLGAQFGNTATMTGIKSLFPQVTGAPNPKNLGVDKFGNMVANPNYRAPSEGGNLLSSLIPESTAGKVALGSAVIPLIGGMGGGDDMSNVPPGFNKNYQKLMESGFAGGPTGFQTRTYNDDGTYSDNTLEDKNTYQSVEAILDEDNKIPAMKTGGIATIAKFNTGGQALPSKFSHDEKDYNNYVRAHGFVEDGAGMGNDNEDTMLAQLADGEFVSRSAAVRGAGIIAGASLSDKEDQRKKGADFFYEQQKRFKRIMDILDASRKDN
jgi:hypothetical protein|tara:strand:+ start:42 stop:1019 length:978 start_codon:yes stop_codon:yes gene_type:complete